MLSIIGDEPESHRHRAALSLGAGRVWQAGVARVLEIMRTETRAAMQQCGMRSLGELNPALGAADQLKLVARHHGAGADECRTQRFEIVRAEIVFCSATTDA
jgi:hypothetical protein